MITSQCAMCGPGAPAELLYPSRIDPTRLEATWFSARRSPDCKHTDIFRCGSCGLLFATPIPEADELAALYHESTFTYADEVPNIRRSYGRCLDRLPSAMKSSLLEVGCGSGFVLEEALDRGYRDVAGIEPSAKAVERASPRVKSRIRIGLFDGAAFPADSFDVVCAFQTFDHLADPAAFLGGVAKVLRPGGALMLVQHDASAWSARLAGERSPIFDIAHPYLYDRTTLPGLLRHHGFRVDDVFRVRNSYSLRYWAHVAPLPWPLAALVRGALAGRAGAAAVTMPAGNFGVIARTPRDA